MGRAIAIEIKESPEELLKLSRKQKHPLAQARLRAFYLYKSGQASSCEQLSQQVGYERHAVGRWVRLYQEQGLEACLDVAAKGRPPGSVIAGRALEELQEILDDFPEGLDYIITGVGTGGHITATAKVLKGRFPNLKVFAVEPSASPVLSGGQPGPHPIQGVGAGFIPSILDTSLLDGVIQVNAEDAFDYTRRAAREEGLFVGISSGSSLAAVAQKLEEGVPEGSRILTFSYDTGERYLSVEGLFV